MQPSPGTFQGFEILLMHDEVDLLREFAINLGDHGRDRLGNVGGDQFGGSQRLLGERANGVLHRRLLLRVARFELLVEQRLKLADLPGSGSGGALCYGLWRQHNCIFLLNTTWPVGPRDWVRR